MTTRTPDAEPLLTPAEVATMFRVDPKTVTRWAKAGKLTSIRTPVHVWQGRHDRMVPYAHGQWLASHIPTAIPHLFDDEGHLSLAVTRFGDILDALVASGR